MTGEELREKDASQLEYDRQQALARIREAGHNKVMQQFPTVDQQALYLGMYPIEVVNSVKQFAASVFSSVIDKENRIKSATTLNQILEIEAE